MSRLAVALFVTVAGVIPSAPALAGDGIASHTDDPAPGYVSTASTSTTSSGGQAHTTRRTYTRAAPVTCQAIDGRVGERHYERIGDVTSAQTPDGRTSGNGGSWYARFCGDSTPAAGCPPTSNPWGCLSIPSDRWGLSGIVWWSFADAFGAGAPVDPRDVAADAYAFLPIPKAAIAFNPPGTSGVPALVSLATWLWVEPSAWAPQISEIEVCCPSVVVRVEATPERASFETGDGATVDCSGPGTPYDPSRPAAAQTTSCSHTYARSSADQPAQQYQVRAAVQWSAVWSVSGAAPPGGGALSPARQTSPPVPVRVGEIQTLNTGGQQ